jgi:serine O-acetyltransferase
VLSADWARSANQTVAQRVSLLIFRTGQLVNRRGRHDLLFCLWRIADLVYLRALLGAELSPTAEVGPGLAIPHAARGVVLGHYVTIGRNSMIFHRVTIGRDGPSEPPRLGDDVYVGVGACILGPVTVGAGARVGANAVVIRDVPDRAIVFGVPARVVKAS